MADQAKRNCEFLMTKKSISSFLLIGLLISLLTPTSLAQLPLSRPETVSVASAQLSQMDGLIEAEIAQHHLPGAVVQVGRKGRIVWHKAYGSRALEPTREAMTTDTIFDLASLTRVATATSILVERVVAFAGRSRCIPEIRVKAENASLLNCCLPIGGICAALICANVGPATMKLSSD
jgi:hypothetical protein